MATRVAAASGAAGRGCTGLARRLHPGASLPPAEEYLPFAAAAQGAGD